MICCSVKRFPRMVVLPAGIVAGRDSQPEWPSFRGAGQEKDTIGAHSANAGYNAPAPATGPAAPGMAAGTGL
jgi:hypothetical protein